MDQSKYRLSGGLFFVAGFIFIAVGGLAQRPIFFVLGCAFVALGGAFVAITRRSGRG